MTLDIHKQQRLKNTLILSLQMITELDGRTVFSETLGYSDFGARQYSSTLSQWLVRIRWERNIIAGVDDKNYFYFKLYESEEEFREATQDWQ